MLEKLLGLEELNTKDYTKYFTADFETTTDPNDCRVWAYAICGIEDLSFKYGNSIEDFFDYLSKLKYSPKIYFHNLKFDGEFIFYYLINNGYKCIKDNKDKETKSYTCLISDMNQLYSIEVYFKVSGKRVHKVTFIDSLKILNMSVDQIAKDFKLPISKLKIDYNEFREKNHILTQKEIDYIRNDVEIMARALKIMFDCNLTKGTIGSDALNDYKEINKNFKKNYPILDINIDRDIRLSYRGGFTYLHKDYLEKTTGEGLVLDVNSLYPSVMYKELLPYDDPVYFEGKYTPDEMYPLYIQSINVSFEIKEGFIPTIQVKKSPSYLFNPTEYLESSNGEIVTLVLTSVDLELFFKHYNIEYLEYNDGYKFKGCRGLFSEYIDKWINVKKEAKREDNGALYKISKLMLNSLYGKFGLNPNIQSKYPVITDEGKIAYEFYDKETRDPVYIPMAAFITSYARFKTITTSQNIVNYTREKYGRNLYVYSDTDSIHTLLTNEEELKSFVDIDDYELGAWKIESKFIKGKYLRAKCYIELSPEGKLNTTIAGLPKDLSDKINFDNFKFGTSFFGKKIPKHVKGGTVLIEDYFTIRRK